MPKQCYGKVVVALLLSGLLTASFLRAQQPGAAKSAKGTPKLEEISLAQELRHQLSVLPYYSVFDYITFTLNGAKVTLTGQVLRPTLRADAEAAAKSLEGVAAVNNLIEILPKSPADDDARRAVYRAIFEDSTLQRYAVPNVPAIHIILKGGQVTLEGNVGSELEKSLATTRASNVAGVSGVKNNLAIHTNSTRAN